MADWFQFRFNSSKFCRYMPKRPRCQAPSRRIARMQQETPDHPDQRLKPATIGVQRFASICIHHPYIIHIYISNYIIHSRKTQDAIDFQWPWPSMAISISPTFSDLRILRRLWRPLCWASRDPKEALKLRKCEKFGPDLLAPLEVKKLA